MMTTLDRHRLLIDACRAQDAQIQRLAKRLNPPAPDGYYVGVRGSGHGGRPGVWALDAWPARVPRRVDEDAL